MRKGGIALKKNDEIEVEIIDNGINLEGIAKYENKVIFIPGALKGEKVKARIRNTIKLK